MQTLFISDCHLCEARPEMIDRFETLMNSLGGTTDALYILGDLFEFWHGDDDLDGEHARIIRAINTVTAKKIPVYFQRGNRDFLAGHGFAQQTGASLLPDYHVTEIYGQRTLLMHGDLLCTDDVAYQGMRRVFSQPWLQGLYLRTPLRFRYLVSARVRKVSQQEIRQKPPQIMDVSPDTVKKTMLEHGVQELIHGHTHRPAVHNFKLTTGTARRIVLGDWYERDSVLVYRKDRQALMSVEEFLKLNGGSGQPAADR